MNKNIHFKSTIILLLILTLITPITGAIISHSPAQVTPGTFAAGNYSFPDSVGIGTTAPDRQFHLRNEDGIGEIIIQGVQNASMGNTAKLWLSTAYSSDIDQTNQEGRQSYIASYATGAWGTDVRLDFATSNAQSSYPTPKMTILPNGNVGIGTTSPNTKLEVNGGDLRIHDSSYARLEWYNDNDAIDSNDYWIAEHNDGGDLKFMRRDDSAGTWGNNLILDQNGDVGIGSSSPSYKLDVSGTGRFTGDLTSTRFVDSGDTSYYADPAETSRFNIIYPNKIDMGASMSIGMNRADDGTYEWVGWYSGSSRAGIFLWDGSWQNCDANKFCVVGDTHQLSLRSVTGDVEISDALDMVNNPIKNIDWANSDDGSGSGLDADTLDGINGANFLRSDTSDTMWGTLTVSDNLDIGGDNGDAYLFLDAGSNSVDFPGIFFRRSNSKKFEIFTDQSDLFVIRDADNSHYAYLTQNANSWSWGSDIRLKSNITPLTGVLDELEKFRVARYFFKNSTEAEIGVIAQELNESFPELVSVNGEGYLGVGYSRLGPIAIQGIKELRQEKDLEMNSLKEQLAIQDDKISKLESKNNLLKQTLCEEFPEKEICNT